MADIGDEVPADRLEPPPLGDILDDGRGAEGDPTVDKGSGPDDQGAAWGREQLKRVLLGLPRPGRVEQLGQSPLS